ncbi:hypothetical protein HK096_007833, partial [Nowakowskiella sp. JEL0078]
MSSVSVNSQNAVQVSAGNHALVTLKSDLDSALLLNSGPSLSSCDISLKFKFLDYQSQISNLN